MTEEIKLLNEVERGRRAQDLLADPLLMEAFGTLEQAYTTAWAGTAVKAVEDREIVWRHMQSLRKVRSHLETAVRTGTMAKSQLNDLHQRRRFGLF
jgi:hypothetical protein